MSEAAIGRPVPENRNNHVILPPPGYRIDHSRVVVDSVNAPAVRAAFELCAQGTYNFKELEKAVFANTGRQFQQGLLRSILGCRFYTGIISFKNRAFKGAHTPLLSTKTFKRVQEVLRRHEQDDTAHSGDHSCDKG